MELLFLMRKNNLQRVNDQTYIEFSRISGEEH